MSEKIVQNRGMWYLRTLGAFVVRVQTGKLQQSYTNKAGNTRGRMVHLADRGTPDTVNCIRGRCVFVEYKKDAKERDKWLKAWFAHLDMAPMPTKDFRTMAQIMKRQEIMEAGGIHIVACCNADIARGLIEAGVFTVDELPFESEIMNE